MESTDLLKPNDRVTVTVTDPDDNRLYQTTGTGYHTIEQAIKEAVNTASLNVSPEDCVFEVANETKGVTHRYRLNAHGHLKLIV